MVVIGIILIIAAVFLTVAVLMQHGKSHNLSGTIAGASETFFGKSKATTVDRKLSILTSVVAVVFVVLVLIAYLSQGTGSGNTDNSGINMAPTESTGVVETEEPTETTGTTETTGATETAEAPASDTAEATEAPVENAAE